MVANEETMSDEDYEKINKRFQERLGAGMITVPNHIKHTGRGAVHLDRLIDRGKWPPSPYYFPSGLSRGRPPGSGSHISERGWHGDSQGHSMARYRAMARSFGQFEPPRYGPIPINYLSPTYAERMAERIRFEKRRADFRRRE